MFAVWAACNGTDGISDIEGKVTRLGASECGQRASFNRDRDLADEPHWCSSVFGCRNACGIVDKIDMVREWKVLPLPGRRGRSESPALSPAERVDDINS